MTLKWRKQKEVRKKLLKNPLKEKPLKKHTNFSSYDAKITSSKVAPEEPESDFFISEVVIMQTNSFLYNSRYDEERTREKPPERNLLAAMIERSILDLKQEDFFLRRSAEKWIFPRGPHREGTFTLAWCLEWLDLSHAINIIRVDCRTLINNKAAGIKEAVELIEKYTGNTSYRELFGL